MSVTDFSKPTPFLVTAISQLDKGSCLDIGCGQGRNALYLAREGWDVTALDPDSDSVGLLDTVSQQEKLSIRTLPIDIGSYESNDHFNLVVCTMVLHFFSKNEARDVIHWMQGHTKSGGMNIVSVFTNENKPGTRPYLFEPDELPSCYSEWDIPQYELADSSILNDDNSTATYSVARIATIKS